MPQTLATIQKQIAQLQAQAAQLRIAEKAGVIAKIRDAIAAYGITPHELFGRRTERSTVAATRGKSVAKYADANGNTWGGRGPRPRWLREALKSGSTLSEFIRGSAKSGETSPAKTARTAGVKRRKRKIPVKYRDSAGNTWTGRGSQPRWLREAIEAGSKLESFSV